MTTIIYIIAGAIGLYLSLLGVMFSLLHGLLFASIVGALLLAAHIASILYVRKKAMEGKGRLAALALIAPMFVVGGGALVIGWGIAAVSFVVSFVEPDSPAFTSECRTAGAQFHKLPSSPVRSIAYDWDGKFAPRFITKFAVSIGGRVVDSKLFSDGYSDHDPYPSVIEFTERKRRPDSKGAPSEAPGPYVRFPRWDGRYPRKNTSYGITTLTADALVAYQLTSTEALVESPPQRGIVTYDLTVTDRRNGEKLASLRYVIDEKKDRACGLTGDNEMDERKFVLKAIGANK